MIITNLFLKILPTKDRRKKGYLESRNDNYKIIHISKDNRFAAHYRSK